MLGDGDHIAIGPDGWKKGAEETEATVREMRRKAKQIAPAYNKGALQYLPKIDRDELPLRDEKPKRK